MNSCNNIVYGLVDPRDMAVRYVGKSTKGLARAAEHRSCVNTPERTHKANWVKKLHKLGMSYGVVVLEYCESAEKLNEAERRWIAHSRKMLGAKLTNSTEGGEGTCGYRHTHEARKKIQLARTGQKHSMKTIEKFRRINGRKHTPETREKMRLARVGKKGRKCTPEICEKIRLAALGRKVSAETREKLRLVNLGKKLSAATCEKMRQANIGRKHTRETCEKIRRAHIGRKFTLESLR